MLRKYILAPALIALPCVASATPASPGHAELLATTHLTDTPSLHVDVSGAQGVAYGIQVSLDPAFGTGVHLMGMGSLDQAGNGQRSFVMPNTAAFPPNTVAYLRAGFRSGNRIEFTPVTALLLNAVPSERIQFDNAPGCVTIANGEPLTDQWADVGVRILVDSHHPTHPPMAIALDSGSPGAETDLATPGRGTGNTVARRNLLVVAGAHNGFTQDGNVSTPTAEDRGGIVYFDFDQPTYLDRITLVDVDVPNSFMRCYDGGVMVAEMGIPAVGDNSQQTIGFPLIPVTRLVVNLRSAAGIAELSYLPCAENIDFDHTMTGIPLGLAEGEVVRDQLRGQYGARVTADTHHATNVGRAIALRPRKGEAQDDCDRRMLGVAGYPTDADNDGIVEDPRPEALGGVIVLDFDFDITWRSASVVDVDDNEVSFFRAEDGNGNDLGTFPLFVGDDGEIQTITPDISGVRRVRLNLGGDGALVSFDYCADAHPDSVSRTN